MITIKLNKMKVHQYCFNYTNLLGIYLKRNKIPHFVTDADIIVISLNAYNDNAFVLLLLDFAQWMTDNKNDMSIYPQANGSQYHIK